MSKTFHKEILTEEQIKLLPLLKKFSKNFYLVGGTAISLHIGHRHSIDYDLFTSIKFNSKSFIERIERLKFRINRIYTKTDAELTLVINSVKVTFYDFPYNIPAPLTFENIINIPDLLDLAAMKAFALGGRGKWKDYVDLYLLLTNYYDLEKICNRAYELFGDAFNSRLFREQLVYFDDIDYEEEVTWLTKPITQQKIKKALIKVATS